jgi:hypothetical protein
MECERCYAVHIFFLSQIDSINESLYFLSAWSILHFVIFPVTECPFLRNMMKCFNEKKIIYVFIQHVFVMPNMDDLVIPILMPGEDVDAATSDVPQSENDF